jgi:DNA-binding XRE family transcriptional regulator
MAPPRGRDLSPEPELVNSIGTRIRAIRTTWMWTQTALAKAIGSNQKTISHWERDSQIPGDLALRDLSRISGIPFLALKFGQGFDRECIPNPPRLYGDLPVAEDQAVNWVVLPEHTGKGICAVDRASESTKVLSVEQAIDELRKAQGEGRPVWLVLGTLWE